MLSQIGKWKVYPLESGDFRLDGGAMMGSVPKVLWEKTNPADELNRIDLSLRCLLLDDGDNRVLIDTGLGTKGNDKFKKIFHIVQPENPLKRALSKIGFSPRDVTHVIFSHLHFDHAGGATELNEEGQPVPAFPNAEYFITESQWKQANQPNTRDKASFLQADFLPVQEAGLLQLIPENTSIINGISTYCVHGHTCGQQLVKLEDGDEALIYCSDLIPLKSHLQIPWIMGYDLNALLTLEEKTQFLAQAGDEDWWLVFDHDPVTAAVKIQQGQKYYDVVDEVLRKFD